MPMHRIFGFLACALGSLTVQHGLAIYVVGRRKRHTHTNRQSLTLALSV
jgi:hypothetical protein